MVSLVHETSGQDRPNILWLTAEDLSPALGCYGDPDATTPNLDAFAKRSLKYVNAFAASPVCSTSRACLINGLPAPMQGTHPMRSKLPLPDSMNGFPALLRKAGYFTSNNVKTDYNSANAPQIIKTSWDENSEIAHWRNAKPGQPFFCIFNFMVSHQSRTMVWDYEQFQKEVQSKLSSDQIHAPDRVSIPPYYPDTPLVRKTVARFHDCVTVMDQQVGKLLQQLEQDGLADNTIVFFYSDHGSGMPRHKRALFDSGMKVPLLIHVPKKYQHWAAAKPGSSTDRLVTFEDFAPTVLSLAGITDVPAHMTGQPFIGPATSNPRRYVFGHRDRVDEIIDMARSVRDKQFLYIRNYMPHLGYNQQSAWIDQGEIRRDFYRLAESGAGTKAQRQYLDTRRPVEELYDCKADPLNLTNLADSEQHQQILKRMRRTNRNHLLQSKDLALIPELELLKISRKAIPYEWARAKGTYFPSENLRAAELVGRDAFDDFDRLLASENPSIRYWACIGISASNMPPKPLLKKLERQLTNDSSIAVRIEAANAVARHGRLPVALETLSNLLDHQDLNVVLHAARTIELLGDKAAKLHAKMLALNQRMKKLTGDEAWFVEFSTSGFLSRVRPNK